MADAAEVARFGIEPDFDRYVYDLNNCSWCGQPVLIVQSRERAQGYRTEQTACPNCMSRMAKRTRAREFRWLFLEGWRPDPPA